MNDRLQQQLQALNRLYKESEHIQQACVEAWHDGHRLLGAVRYHPFRRTDDAERPVQ